jgi:hypothetical protein
LILVTPASYLTLAQIKSDETLDLTTAAGVQISDATLNDWLEETTGEIDAMIKQSFLPEEKTISLQGSGSNLLETHQYPLIYVRQVKIVLPNAVGFDIPTQSLLVDYESGTLLNMSPLTFQGVGIQTLFPKGVKLQITLATGVNYAVPPPAFTISQQSGVTNAFSAGSHTVQLTTLTCAGESLPSSPQTITLPGGCGINVNVTNAPGGLRYLVYIDGTCRSELVSMAIGTGMIGVTIDNSTPTLQGCFTLAGQLRTPPSVDTSAIPLTGKFGGLRAAQKKLMQSRAWELKNKSNQGIAGQTSGSKSVRYRDNTRSTFNAQLDSLLSSLVYQGIA